MSGLQHRVLIVLRGSEHPLSCAQIAHILGANPMRLSSAVSKLVAYGRAEIAERRPPEHRGDHWRRYYRAKQEVTA